MAVRAVHVLIRGRVQGVGFRAFVEGEAVSRELGGWVRNRYDGTVEAVFSGEADTIEAMLSACRRGPRGSRVDELEVLPAGAVTGEFEVLPTA